MTRMGHRRGDGLLAVAWWIFVFFAWMLLMEFGSKKAVGGGDESTLRSSPKLSAAGYQGSVITFFLHLAPADSCMGRRWVWPDGTESYHESDCDPDQELEQDSESKRVVFYRGNWKVYVRLEQPKGKLKKELCTTFFVGG